MCKAVVHWTRAEEMAQVSNSRQEDQTSSTALFHLAHANF